MTGTQGGKSFLQENVIGQRLDDDPCPVLYYSPTKKMVTDKVVDIVDEMIASSASLSAKLDKSRSKQFIKYVGGGKLHLMWMGSESETSATSGRLMLIDELDRCSKNREGNIVKLVEARGDAYVDSMVGITATPTHGRIVKEKHDKTGFEHWPVTDSALVGSATWLEWQNGTRHEWAVPCPNCEEFFIPHLGLLHWDGKGEEDCTLTLAEKTAHLKCPNCGKPIHDHHRKSMNTQGDFVAPGEYFDKGQVVQNPAIYDNSHHSFWVSGLCSLSAKKTYGYIARDLQEAQASNDPDKLLPAYNTGGGECFSLVGKAPSWEKVKAKAWRYHRGELIGKPEMILSTVDVQINRLVYVIRAWFPEFGSALIESGEYMGDPKQDHVWENLSRMLDRSWNGYGVDQIGVDCGYLDDEVFRFVNGHRGRTRALRGGSLDKPFRVINLDVDHRGKVRKYGSKRWEFSSQTAKLWVHSRIEQSHERRGFWVLPADIDKDYCRQIVGEEFDEIKNVFNPVYENHFLDCEAMNYMLARMMGLENRTGDYLLDGISAEFITQKTGEKRTIEPTTVTADSHTPSMAELGKRLGNRI